MILTDFIVFEGIDGAGTSTQLNLISQKLGETAWVTAEPTDSPIGRLIREFLKGKFSLTENTVTRLLPLTGKNIFTVKTELSAI